MTSQDVLLKQRAINQPLQEDPFLTHLSLLVMCVPARIGIRGFRRSSAMFGDVIEGLKKTAGTKLSQFLPVLRH